jgi:glycosyltransferase involved in cell wall biosynthesis
LKKIGHDVTVLSGPNEQVFGLSDELREVGIRHFKSRNIDKMTVHNIYKSKNDIKRILELKDVDVIHAQGAIHALPAYLAVRSIRSAERPSIVTSVHSTPKEGLLQKPKWMAMTTILNMCSDVILPVSDNTRERLIRHGGTPKKTITIHNAIDLEVFDAASRRGKIDFGRDEIGKPTIVCVANLTPIKGQDYYLMANAEVLRRHPARFYVVGSGPQRKYLEELAHRLGIEKEIVFTGRIQWPEIYHFLSNIADICVSSSISENFPFYVLECMAAGKPIVATNVGGVSECVIDGVTGYLVPPKDPASLAIAIGKLIDDPDHARKMGAEARKTVEQKFSMQVVTKKLCEIYESAVRSKQSPTE